MPRLKHPLPHRQPAEKVFVPSNLPTKETDGATKSKLTSENVEQHGFTKHEKNKLTGMYHKTAGSDERSFKDTHRLGAPTSAERHNKRPL